MKILIAETMLRVDQPTGEQFEDLLKITDLLELRCGKNVDGNVEVHGVQKHLYNVLFVLAKKYDIELV